jgi:hypothetical protein
MDKIIELSEQIDNISNINDKVRLIKTLNELIEIEKNNLNNILNSDIKNFKTKIPLKYKKMSIDELEQLFIESTNINDKILIYMAIDKYYTNIEEELFDMD